MYDPLFSTLAETGSRVFQEMTGTPVTRVSIQREQRTDVRYAVAVTLNYRHMDKAVGGAFSMGFLDPRMALGVATAVAEKLGLSKIGELDQLALDVLHELINTIFGRAVQQWEQQGFRAQFGPPASGSNVVLAPPAGTACESRLIVLSLPIGQITFQATIIENERPTLKGKRILITDDSTLMRTVIRKHLEELEADLEEAKDGSEAVAKFRAFRPDLLIMDQVMPNMNGLDAVLEIHKIAPEAKFIMLTSTARKDEVVTAKTLKANGYLLKPIKPAELVKSVLRALGAEAGH